MQVLSLALFLGVCSHEHVQFSLFLLCACYSAGSFIRLSLEVCLMSLYQFSLFSALRLLQRWIFTWLFQECLPHEHVSSLFSAPGFLQRCSFTRSLPEVCSS
jgi:hypothetical protein